MTLEISVALACSVMSCPTMFALLTSSEALTIAMGFVSGVPSVPTVAVALSTMSPAVSVTPELKEIVSALTVRLAPPRLTLPMNCTASTPPPPLIVSEVKPAIVMLWDSATSIVSVGSRIWTRIVPGAPGPILIRSRCSKSAVSAPLTMTFAAVMGMGSTPP